MPDQRLPRTALTAWSTEVAPALLGARLVSTVGGALVAVRLTEVEAYMGERDPASHAFRGRTPRNAVMFGPRRARSTSTSPTACTGARTSSAGAGGRGVRGAAPRRRGGRRAWTPPARTAPCRPSRRATWPAARPGSRPRSASTAALDGADLCAPSSPLWLEAPQVARGRRPDRAPGGGERRRGERRDLPLAVLAGGRPDRLGLSAGTTASPTGRGRLAFGRNEPRDRAEEREGAP